MMKYSRRVACLVAFAMASAMQLRAQTTLVSARSARLTDEVIASDLRKIDSIGDALHRDAIGRLSPIAPLRSSYLLALARQAYEGNDDGELTERLIAAARVASTQTPGSNLPSIGSVIPRTRRPDLWAVFDSVAQTPTGDKRVVLLAALESALLRAQYAVLGAPSCDIWEGKAIQIVTELRKPLPAPPQAPLGAEAPPPAPAPVLTPPPPRSPEVLRSVPTMVHFALDKSYPAPASRAVLDKMISAISAYPDVTILLEGNTDKRASVEYNLALSRRRAASVRAYLVSKGLDNTRISVQALGESQLVTDEEGIRNHAINRRVLLRYYGSDGKEIPTTEQLDDLQLETPKGRKTP